MQKEVENGIHRCNTTDIKVQNEYFKDTTFKDNIELGILWQCTEIHIDSDLRNTLQA